MKVYNMWAMNHEAKRLTYRVELPGGQARLREMILYVAKKSEQMPRFGKTKLNKILWDADFSAFAERGTPVTGRPYHRLPAGPGLVEMQTLLAEMDQDDLIAIENFDFGGGKVEQRIISKVEFTSRLFSEDDLHYVDRAIERFWTMSAKEASDESHGVAWATREDLDPLPYEASILSDEPLSGHSLDRLKKIGQELGWKSR